MIASAKALRGIETRPSLLIIFIPAPFVLIFNNLGIISHTLDLHESYKAVASTAHKRQNRST
jgi:hypothetical protein